MNNPEILAILGTRMNNPEILATLGTRMNNPEILAILGTQDTGRTIKIEIFISNLNGFKI